MKPSIEIHYCPGCRWLLRAAWMAQELLSTFESQLGSVALVPDESGGVFQILIDGELLWCRQRDGGFPGAKELKQRVRDVVKPDQDLGHVDR